MNLSYLLTIPCPRNMAPAERNAVLVFRRPIFFTDSLLALRAGPLVHVDILPMDPATPANTLSYTSYVGYPFTVSISDKTRYDNETCVALAIPLAEAEHEALVGYLCDLCGHNIPYNYVDVATMALPQSLQTSLKDDLSSEAPADITHLFCSQAAVLALRNALAERRPLLELLRHVNSRCVTPYDLFHMLRPHAQPVCCLALGRGAVVPRPLPGPV